LELTPSRKLNTNMEKQQWKWGTALNSTHYDVHSFGKAMSKLDSSRRMEFTPPRLGRVSCFAHLIASNGVA